MENLQPANEVNSASHSRSVKNNKASYVASGFESSWKEKYELLEKEYANIIQGTSKLSKQLVRMEQVKVETYNALIKENKELRDSLKELSTEFEELRRKYTSNIDINSRQITNLKREVLMKSFELTKLKISKDEKPNIQVEEFSKCTSSAELELDSILSCYQTLCGISLEKLDLDTFKCSTFDDNFQFSLKAEGETLLYNPIHISQEIKDRLPQYLVEGEIMFENKSCPQFLLRILESLN
ncbi:hypothetical protein ABK040_006698 [Willaertia magna]